MGNISRRQLAVLPVLALTPCVCRGTSCCVVPPLVPDAFTLAENILQIDTKKVPELRRPGGQVVLNDEARKLAVIVVRVSKSRFVAAASRCTHGGGHLTWLADLQVLHCTC